MDHWKKPTKVAIEHGESWINQLQKLGVEKEDLKRGDKAVELTLQSEKEDELEKDILKNFAEQTKHPLSFLDEGDDDYEEDDEDEW